MPKLKMELDSQDIDTIEKLLMDLDTEVGSTINSVDDKEKVYHNMANINYILNDLKTFFNIKF